MLRKAVLFGIAATLKIDRRLQGLFGMLVLVISIALHARRLPYVMPLMNQFEMLSLITTGYVLSAVCVHVFRIP